MFIVISYDIEDDKLRTKLAKVLEGHGERVQYSVFECHLDEKQLRALEKRINTGLLQKRVPEDSLFSSQVLYRLCANLVSRKDKNHRVWRRKQPTNRFTLHKLFCILTFTG